MGAKGRKHTVLDVGSTLDLFPGHLIRDYISKNGDRGWCAKYGDLLPEQMCKGFWKPGEPVPEAPAADGWIVPFVRNKQAA
jgi:hypothetical protein